MHICAKHVGTYMLQIVCQVFSMQKSKKAPHLWTIYTGVGPHIIGHLLTARTIFQHGGGGGGITSAPSPIPRGLVVVGLWLASSLRGRGGGLWWRWGRRLTRLLLLAGGGLLASGVGLLCGSRRGGWVGEVVVGGEWRRRVAVSVAAPSTPAAAAHLQGKRTWLLCTLLSSTSLSLGR